MNKRLENRRKRTYPNLRYVPDIWLKVLSQTAKYTHQDSDIEASCGFLRSTGARVQPRRKMGGVCLKR
jgi:hypothetical protein